MKRISKAMIHIGILSLFLFSLLLLNCCCAEISEGKEEMALIDIPFTETPVDNFDISNIEFPVTDIVNKYVPTTNSIHCYSDALMFGYRLIAFLHNNQCFEQYKLASISHATSDNVWVFEYSYDQPESDIIAPIDGGVMYVMIDGESCKIVIAWVEE